MSSNFDITSRDNPLVKKTAALLKSAEERREQGLFLMEGAVVLKEAAACGAGIDKVFCLDRKDIDGIALPDGCKIYQVTQPVMEKISGVRSPQGVVFACRLPEPGIMRGDRVLALENLSDPGNMGTIIRTAEAFGIDTLVLTGRCADIYSPKVARATMGALLRVNICFMSLDDFISGAKMLSLPVYAAALRPDAEAIKNISLARCAVMIGNEAHGLSQAALDKCDKSVIIPISGIESLNAAVAASIFMYEMSSQR